MLGSNICDKSFALQPLSFCIVVKVSLASTNQGLCSCKNGKLSKFKNEQYTESEPDKADYKPLNAKYGEYIMWDGANCRHGNKKIEEGFTRVSFDFRVKFR